MVRSDRRCQLIHRSLGCHVLGSSHIWLLLSVSCGLSGCWQETRYEPAKIVQKAPNVEQKVEVSTPETSLAVSAVDMLQAGEVGPMPEPPSEMLASVPEEIEPSRKAEDGLGNSTFSDRAPSADAVDPFDRQTEPATVISAAQSTETPDSATTALSVWKMSSDWSMAAALQAKGREVEGYGEQLTRAQAEAQLIGVVLPELPTHEVAANRLATNLSFLLDHGGPELARNLSQQFGTDAAALAELATKTHVLLLSYTPTWTRLDPVVESIRSAAEASGLPEPVWRELVDLLIARADFKQVKAAIFQLHRHATAYLTDLAN